MIPVFVLRVERTMIHSQTTRNIRPTQRLIPRPQSHLIYPIALCLTPIPSAPRVPPKYSTYQPLGPDRTGRVNIQQIRHPFLKYCRRGKSPPRW